MSSNIALFDTLRSVAIASITGSYTAFGTIFPHAMRLLDFDNDSNGVYLISFDGVNPHVALPANGYVVYDVTTNEDARESFRNAKGTQVWIKYIVEATTQPVSSNTVYFTTIYGKGE